MYKEKLNGSRKLATYTIASQSKDSSKGYQYACQIVDMLDGNRDYSLYRTLVLVFGQRSGKKLTQQAQATCGIEYATQATPELPR